MAAREIQYDSQRFMILLVNFKMHFYPILAEVYRTDVGIFRLNTVTTYLAGNGGKHSAYIWIVQAQHCQPVERQVMQKLHEGLAQALKIPLVGR